MDVVLGFCVWLGWGGGWVVFVIWGVMVGIGLCYCLVGDWYVCVVWYFCVLCFWVYYEFLVLVVCGGIWYWNFVLFWCIVWVEFGVVWFV